MPKGGTLDDNTELVEYKLPVLKNGAVIGYALVDQDDFERLLRFTWGTVNGYVRRTKRVAGAMKVYYLHREVLGLTEEDSVAVDHRNEDRFDNRRSNLRVGSKSQNLQNRSRGNRTSRWGTIPTSAHRGVSWDKRRSQYRVTVRTKIIGYYSTEEEAEEVARNTRLETMEFANG